ncbi:MAG: DUF4169 family protein [Rhizobiaceae bacterium]
MGEIVNLRLARKAKAKTAKDAAADQNRSRFGEPKHLREKAEALKRLEKQKLDGHRLADSADDAK